MESRKRAREEEEEAAGDNTEILQAKKQEFSITYPADEFVNEYEFHDGIGVFDFPWLKDGVVFNSASFEDHEDKFAPTSYLQEYSSSVAAEYADNNKSSSSSVQKQNQNQNQNQNVCEGKKKDEEDDSFWSLVVDDLEPLDCIWSSVIDQSLDVGFHKG